MAQAYDISIMLVGKHKIQPLFYLNHSKAEKADDRKQIEITSFARGRQGCEWLRKNASETHKISTLTRQSKQEKDW